MSKVPESIKSHLASSWSALEDSDTIGGAFKHNATRYFLLITAWELYELANAELSAWVWKRAQECKIYKDHASKLTKAPAIHHILIKDGKPIETSYATAEEISKIRQWTIFGKDGTSRIDVFFRGWHFDTFRNRLISRWKFLDITIKAIEELDVQGA